MPIDDRELRRAAAAFVDQIRAERPVLHLLDRTMQRRGDGMKLSYRLEVCVVRRAGRDQVLGVDLVLDRAGDDEQSVIFTSVRQDD